MRIGVHNNNHPFSTCKSCRKILDLFEMVSFQGNYCRECANRIMKKRLIIWLLISVGVLPLT